MNNHPYPEHIRDKVALGLFAADCEDNPELDPNEEPHPGYYEYADTALQALWDASRVDSADDMPNETVLRGKTDFVYEKWPTGWHQSVPNDPVKLDPEDFPAHVIYWGDRGE